MLLFKFFLISFSVLSFAQEDVYIDKFAFKVGSEAYTVSDIETSFSYLRFIDCIQPNNFLVSSSFLPLFQLKEMNFKSVKSNESFTNDEKKYFKKVIPFYKMLIYKNTYEIVVKKDLVQAMELQARKNSCLQFLSKKSNTVLSSDENFKNIMQLELFLRSRFWNSDKTGPSNSQEFQKAVKSALELTKSVSKQITHQLYWIIDENRGL